MVYGIRKKVRDLIFQKKDIWFHDEPTMEEIEYNWNTSLRHSKNNYFLRTFVQRSKNQKTVNLKIWDSEQNLINMEDLTFNDSLISILEIQGLKYTSQSFHLEICMRQIMIIKENPMFNTCLIKIRNNNSKDDSKTVNRIDMSLKKTQDNSLHETNNDLENLERENDESNINNLYEKTENDDETKVASDVNEKSCI